MRRRRDVRRRHWHVGADGRLLAGAGAVATAGAATGGGASASQGAAGCACVVSDGAAAGAPGTPPVTLIESSPESSLLAAS